MEIKKAKTNLFGWESDKTWKKEWVGMPEFVQEDKEPLQHIVVNFELWEDVQEFAKLIGQSVTPRTNSLWFPPQSRIEPKNFLYINES